MRPSGAPQDCKTHYYYYIQVWAAHLTQYAKIQNLSLQAAFALTCEVNDQRQKGSQHLTRLAHPHFLLPSCGVFYSCLGHREGAYNPCPKWARIYKLMTESGSKAFPASRAPEV